MVLHEDVQKITYKDHNCASEIRGYHKSAEEENSLLAYDVVQVDILVQKLRLSFLPPCSVYHQPTTGQYATYVRPFVLRFEPSLGLMITFYSLVTISVNLRSCVLAFSKTQTLS